MPKYGTHKVVLDETLSRLPTEYRTLMEQHMAAANLGAIGPDLFFFSKEYPSFHVIMEIAKTIKKIIGIIDDIKAPFEWFNENIIEKISDYRPGDLLDKIFDTQNKCKEYEDQLELLETKTLDLFSAMKFTLKVDGFVYVIDVIDDSENVPNVIDAVFRKFFEPELQSNGDLNTWKWFDMLHYRETGTFAQNLWKVAKDGSDQQKAYTLGYLTHIATDVVGHAYVNTIVGGPYRTHIWRHVTVEN